MFQVSLINNKVFLCDKDTTILNAAKSAGLLLEHSCLTARCRSCVVKVLKGSTVNIQKELVLSDEERNENFVLSCNAKPISDLSLDIEDLGDVVLYDKKIVPSKIDTIENMTEDVIKVTLRFPPNANFKFTSGQYVNLIKGDITRSYSIANKAGDNSKLDFFIKKYEHGLMSNYWFNEAKVNNLLRLEGPLGTFFYRKSQQSEIIFLATGTGIAPIKALLEELEASEENYTDKTFWLFVGAREEKDFFWTPKNSDKLNIKYIPVLSRAKEDWQGEKGYIQNILLKQNLDLTKAQVYACGSNKMIDAAKEILIKNKLPEHQFYSDAFICTN